VQRLREIQPQTDALSREREYLVLTLELRLRLPPRPQRLEISLARALLFFETLLGIKIFYKHIHLREG
jgi:hypothetical protein